MQGSPVEMFYRKLDASMRGKKMEGENERIIHCIFQRFKVTITSGST